MSADPLQSQIAEMSLRKAWGYYFICLVACILLGLILFEFDLSFLTVVPYFVCGVLLNRIVLRNLVRFHPIYDTLSNVTNTKLTAVVVWPVFYVVILLKLMIVKYL